MLEVSRLQARYGRAVVLHGVDLRVAAGEVVGLLGRNGMGKTTLVRAIMGLAPPETPAGSVRWEGCEIRGRPPHLIAREGISIVPQGRRLFPSLSVMEHLTTLKPARARNGWTVARVLELFPRLGERRDLGGQLSGGEQQMLAIGRALMTDPRLLLMDEPTEGLAPVMVQHVCAIIAELRTSGLAILMVEQNLFSALSVSDRIYVMDTGMIVHEQPTATATVEALLRFLAVH